MSIFICTVLSEIFEKSRGNFLYFGTEHRCTKFHYVCMHGDIAVFMEFNILVDCHDWLNRKQFSNTAVSKFFRQLLRSGGQNMRRHEKLRQNQSNGCGNIANFWFSRWWPSAILDSQNFKFVVARWVVCANTHQRTKFHQNW